MQLCREGTIKHQAVHVLVLEAFVGPRPEGMWALHGPLRYADGTPDNRLSNLEWGTPSKNNGPDKTRDVTHPPFHGTVLRGEAHGSAKLNWGTVQEFPCSPG